MDTLETIFEQIRGLNMEKEIEAHILYKIDSIKSHILDVITYSKTYEEIKDNVPFPAFFDSDNGILYAYQTQYNNKPAFFVLVWKDGKLGIEVMNFDLKADSFSRQPKTSDKPDEKEEFPRVEIMEGIPEEKEEFPRVEIMEGIPEEKDELSQEEEFVEGIPEEKDELSQEEINLD